MSYNEYIEYFELQAQNFMKDFETKEKNADGIYIYHPQFLPDIDEMILDCGLDDNKAAVPRKRAPKAPSLVVNY